MCLLSAFIFWIQVVSKTNSLTNLYSCKGASGVTGDIALVIYQRLKTQLHLACWSPSWTPTRAQLTEWMEISKIILQ